MLFICYQKCTTCKKAEAWLKNENLTYTTRDIKTDNPTKEELRLWISNSHLPIKRFFNTSGDAYRNLSMKDKLPTMSEEECIELLSTNGMLVKRPLLISDDTVLVGFKEEEWKKKLS